MKKKILSVFSLLLICLFCVPSFYAQAQPPSPEGTLFQGNVRFTDYLTIGDAAQFFTFPIERGAEGEILIIDSEGNLDWGLLDATQIVDNSITTIKIADEAITEDKIAASVVGDGLEGGAGEPLSVDVDDTTIEVGAEGLQVKDGGIAGAKIQDGAITAPKMVNGSGEALDNGTADQLLKSNGDGTFSWTDPPQGGDDIPRVTSAYIVVEVSEESDAVTNGEKLLYAYGVASDPLFQPNGSGKSATNRAVVFVFPGQYDLGTEELLLDTDFVDIIGMSTARDNQHIFGVTGGFGTGVITQTASDVRLENLRVTSKRTSSGSVSGSANDPAAYFPDGSSFANTVIRNCGFYIENDDSWTMRVKTEYDGTYENCVAGEYAFGGLSGGVASGVFTKCVAGDGAFGGSGGTASGVFRDCIGGDEAFGGNGNASGTFRSCEAGMKSFGGGDDGSGDDARMWSCVGLVDSFGSGSNVRDCLYIDGSNYYYLDGYIRSPQ